MTPKPPTKIYNDSIEENPTEVFGVEKEATVVETAQKPEILKVEPWTEEQEKELEKRLQKLKELETRLKEINTKNNETIKNPGGIVEQTIPSNQHIENWVREVLLDNDIFKKDSINFIRVRKGEDPNPKNPHVVIDISLLVETRTKIAESKFDIIFVLENTGNGVGVMQTEVKGKWWAPVTKNAIESVVKIKLANFSEKIKEYVAKKEKGSVTKMHIEKGELEAIVKKNIQATDGEVKADQEITLVERLFEAAKNDVEALRAKKEQAEIVQLETTAGILEGETPVTEIQQEELTKIEEPIVEHIPDVLDNITEGTVLFYKDGVMGGESTIVSIPSEETKDKYVVKHSSGKIFKVTRAKLKELIEDGSVSMLPQSEKVVEKPISVEPHTESQLTDIEIDNLGRKIKPKIRPLSENDLHQLTNNTENITDLETWEKVKIMLTLPKNKIIPAVEELEKRAKNETIKNVQNEAQLCLLMLSKVMKIQIENKKELGIEELQNKLRDRLAKFLEGKIHYTTKGGKESSTLFLDEKNGVTVTAHENQFEIEMNVIEKEEDKKLLITTTLFNDGDTVAFGPVTYTGSSLVKSMMRTEPSLERVLQNVLKETKALHIENNMLIRNIK